MKATPRPVLLLLLCGAYSVWAAPPQFALRAGEDGRQLREKGVEHFYNLEYDQAIAIFEKLRDADPTNPSWQNHVAAAYFYQQLYLAGVLQGDLFTSSNKFFRTKKIQPDPTLEKNFWKANEAAIRICKLRLKEDKKDQEALYACGVAYSTKAIYQGLIERSKFAFLGNARKANDYHSRLARLNPRYYDAYLIPGLFDFVLGSLPGPLKVLLYFAGLSGDKQRGIHAVETVSQWGEQAKSDAKIVLAVMYRREKRHADARRVIHDLAREFPRNYILPLEIASIYRSEGEEEEAIREYEQVLDKIRRGTPGYGDAPVARIHYELGELYRKEGDLESALRHLEQVPGAKGGTPELEKQSAVTRKLIQEELRRRKPTEPLPAGDSVARKNPLPAK